MLPARPNRGGEVAKIHEEEVMEELLVQVLILLTDWLAQSPTAVGLVVTPVLMLGLVQLIKFLPIAKEVPARIINGLASGTLVLIFLLFAWAGHGDKFQAGLTFLSPIIAAILVGIDSLGGSAVLYSAMSRNDVPILGKARTPSPETSFVVWPPDKNT